MRTHRKRRFTEIAGRAGVLVAAALFASPHVAAVAFVIGLYVQNA